MKGRRIRVRGEREVEGKTLGKGRKGLKKKEMKRDVKIRRLSGLRV